MMILKLFVLFFKIGLFSFGGGYAILPLIYQGANELTGMTPEEFSQLVALSQVTPGPVVINAATYVGYNNAGVAGATAATIGVILPSLVLVFAVALFLNKFMESDALQGVLRGIRPVTIGLLASAVIFLSQGSIFAEMDIKPIPFIFFAAFLLAAWRFKADPIILTVSAGIAGAIFIR